MVHARTRRPPSAASPSGPPSVLGLHRAAGNQAVARQLAGSGRPAAHAVRGAPTVQRCGPVACDCSPEQRAAHAAEGTARTGAGAVATADTARGTPATAGDGTVPEGVTLQRVAAPGTALQRLPGDGMMPPGDCSWAKYIPLRLSVTSAKAVVSGLGACTAGDSCHLLAAKIAAISAEIAARVAVAYTCFRGGDTGHQTQLQAKVNMLNRCYRFFQGSNCPQRLVEAMAAVVAAARAAIEATIVAAAAAVVIAAVVALVVAVIALAEAIAAAIAAAAAAAAEAALVASAAAAVIVLLVALRDALSSGGSTSA
ncbi:hypothetical protein [Geodermatophilus sp. CPCC 205761]|uniref:hypothetical protein n=1 Tax=Geodermatophilus sp. CPCC 205761 TaxID=2936597 RepID=UPI003F5361FD